MSSQEILSELVETHGVEVVQGAVIEHFKLACARVCADSGRIWITKKPSKGLTLSRWLDPEEVEMFLACVQG